MSEQDAATTTLDAPQDGTEGKSADGGKTLPDDPAALRAELERVRREAAGYRTKLREAEPFVVKARELEEAGKTEAQRLTEALTQHQSRAEKAEGELLRLTVGIEKGLTPAQARRLVGTTKEELESDADDLLESFGGGKNPPQRKPTERLRGGGDPDLPVVETDPGKLAARIRERGQF